MFKGVVAIIPARGGSKGIPKKNIKILKGHPVLAYSIVASKLSKLIERTIVSTDSQEIADIATKYGAEVPFLRPAEYAKDNSLDIEWVKHAIYWFRAKETYIPEYIVMLRPTTPLREPEDIDKAIQIMKETPEATSMRSAHKMTEHPFKCFMLSKNKYWTGLLPENGVEYQNLPRQSFPEAYQPNGYIDIIKPEYILETDKLNGDKILSFITKRVTELDEEDDFNYLLTQVDKSSIYRHLWEST